MIPGYTKEAFTKKAAPTDSLTGAHKQIYDRAAKANLPMSMDGTYAISKSDMNRAKSSDAAPYGVLNMWNTYNKNGIQGNPQRWFDGIFNPTNDPTLSANFKAIDTARHKARAKYHGVQYSPGTQYYFKNNVSKKHYVPVADDNAPYQATRFMLSNDGRGYANDNYGFGLLTNDMDTIFHEGIPITGHLSTLGNSYGGTNHPKNFMFSSAPHGEEGSKRFQAWLKTYGSGVFHMGENTPGSYYNSIPELTGLLNRSKTQSTFTTTPWTTLKFDMDDPNRKSGVNPDGTYDLQDYLINSGIAKWDSENSRLIPQFSIEVDKSGKPYIHTNKYGPVANQTWMDNGIRPKGSTDAQFRQLQQDALDLVDPRQNLALIHQLNRVYHLKKKQRLNTITPKEQQELDRVLDLYPKYAEQAVVYNRSNNNGSIV